MNEIQKSRVDKIAVLHNEIGGYLKMTLGKAIEIGGLLVEQKAELKHGEWLSWVKENLPFSERLARDYMKFHDNRDELKTAKVADMNAARVLLSPKEWDDPEYYWNGPAIWRQYEKTGDPLAVVHAITRMWQLVYDDFCEQDVTAVEKWQRLQEGLRKHAQFCATVMLTLEAKFGALASEAEKE